MTMFAHRQQHCKRWPDRQLSNRHLPNRPLPNKQKGVAIITALLIVAIATTISATMATRLQLDIRRTSNILVNEQSVFYTLPSED